MHPESLGFQIQHTRVETYCDGCGNPESSNEHGMDCPRSPEYAHGLVGFRCRCGWPDEPYCDPSRLIADHALHVAESSP